MILQGLIKEVYVYIYYLESLKPKEVKKQVRHFSIDEDEEGEGEDDAS